MTGNGFYNAFDWERREPKRAKDGEFRTAFQQDRDGVIYSSAFRRLQAKTQVFLSGQYDFYRTRLTHSIEVAQIGRSICCFLERGPDGPFGPDFHPDADLVESVCLTHDLGHPPFGHAGERTLHRLMRECYGGFEGNAQSLRIVGDSIYTAGGRPRGLNPTRAFVDGILKYKRLWSEDTTADNHFLYDGQAEWREFAIPCWREVGDRLNAFRSLECQIMDWADDTAYSINDIADGVNAGFLDEPGIRAWAKGNAGGAREGAWIDNLLKDIREGYVNAWAGKKIGRFIAGCRVVERDNPMASHTNRYRFGLEIDPDIRGEAALYQRLSVDLVFRSPNIQQLEYKGDYILGRVFEAFRRMYVEVDSAGPPTGLLPAHFECRMRSLTDAASRARLLRDYLAGMTDGFATRTYKRLFDPDFGSISEMA